MQPYRQGQVFSYFHTDKQLNPYIWFSKGRIRAGVGGEGVTGHPTPCTNKKILYLTTFIRINFHSVLLEAVKFSFCLFETPFPHHFCSFYGFPAVLPL